MTTTRQDAQQQHNENTESTATQMRQASLDLASIFGASAAPSTFQQILSAMRPESPLMNNQLPGLTVTDNGGFSDTNRPDGTVMRRYNNGASATLDSQRRITNLTLPGRDGISIGLEYQGDGKTPSAVRMPRDKFGPLKNGVGADIQVDHRQGVINIVTDDYQASYSADGRSHRQYSDGSTETTLYSTRDRTNTTTEIGPDGTVRSTMANRDDGSGYTILAGQMVETRFRPGTSISYDDPSGRRHTFSAASMYYSNNATNDVFLHTRDGRAYEIRGVWSAGNNGPNFAAQVLEHNSGIGKK